MVMRTQPDHSLIERNKETHHAPFYRECVFSFYCDVFQFDCRYNKYEVERHCRLFDMAS